MAAYLKDILGSMLVQERLGGTDNPSPAELMGKFILKGKILAPLLPTEGLEEDELKEVVGLNKGQHHANEVTLPQLAELVVYCRATKLESFSTAQKYSHFDMCSSINAEKAGELAKTDSGGFVRHTNFQLIRVYPHAMNQLSQNYDPIVPWANGCQIVALNYQTKVSVLD